MTSDRRSTRAWCSIRRTRRNRCSAGTAPPVPFLPESVHGKPIIAVGGCWSGELDAGEAATAAFRSLGTVISDVFAPNPYAAWQQALDPLFPRCLLYTSDAADEED